jgi:hypothetical protein
MAKWRAEIDIAFDTEDEVIALANLIEGIKSKVYKFTGSIETETKFSYHLCYHDETPPKPCGAYKSIDFSKAKEEHKDSEGNSVDFSSLNVEKKT